TARTAQASSPSTRAPPQSAAVAVVEAISPLRLPSPRRRTAFTRSSGSSTGSTQRAVSVGRSGGSSSVVGRWASLASMGRVFPTRPAGDPGAGSSAGGSGREGGEVLADVRRDDIGVRGLVRGDDGEEAVVDRGACGVRPVERVAVADVQDLAGVRRAD